jgi:acyl-CoA thioesterase FadM
MGYVHHAKYLEYFEIGRMATLTPIAYAFTISLLNVFAL